MQPKKFVIRKSPSSAPAPAPNYYQPTPRPQQYRASPSPCAPRQKKDDAGQLCFWLGVLFGPFGLLLAAIVGKAAGLIKALRGFFFVGIPLTLLVWWGFASLSAHIRRQRWRSSYSSARLGTLCASA